MRGKETKTGGKHDAVRFMRVSSSGQEDTFSLTSQEKLATEYASKQHLKIVRSWSEVESASKEEKRTAFFELVEFVKKHGIRHVIFDKVDRAVRGLKSAVIIEELIKHHDVKFHFTRDNLTIDIDSPPQEKLRFYLGTILAAYYIDNLKSEIKKGVSARLEAGHWSWKAPLGYLNWRDPETKQSVVIKDPVAAPALEEIFQKYATGNYPMPNLIGILNDATGKKQSWKALEHVMSNPFYYGAMDVKGKVMQGKHDAIISKTTFDACQKIRALRAKKYLPNGPISTVVKPFMGLMKCGLCGKSVTGEAKVKGSGKTYVYYHCGNQGCRQKGSSTPQDRIHEQLVAAFKPFERFTPRATEIFIQTMQEKLAYVDAYCAKESADLAEKRAEIKHDCDRILKLKKDGVVSESEYGALIKVKEAALDELAVEIGAHAKADVATFKQGLRIIELFTKVSRFMELSGNWLEKAELARMVLSNVSLKDGTLSFDYQSPFDVLLKLAGGRGWW